MVTICSPRPMRAALLAYPDGCTRGETVFDPQTGNVLVQMPPLAEDKLYPKEQSLVDLVAAERLAGRKVLVYATHTGTRDITERMEQFLTRHGFRVAVLKADTVAPDRREAWVDKRVKQGVDVVVCHPRLVQTGLNLVDFPAICWFETEFSIFQSTQKTSVLLGSRFGSTWGGIGINRQRRATYLPSLVDLKTGLPTTYGFKPSAMRRLTQRAVAVALNTPPFSMGSVSVYGRDHLLRCMLHVVDMDLCLR